MNNSSKQAHQPQTYQHRVRKLGQTDDGIGGGRSRSMLSLEFGLVVAASSPKHRRRCAGSYCCCQSIPIAAGSSLPRIGEASSAGLRCSKATAYQQQRQPSSMTVMLHGMPREQQPQRLTSANATPQLQPQPPPPLWVSGSRQTPMAIQGPRHGPAQLQSRSQKVAANQSASSLSAVALNRRRTVRAATAALSRGTSSLRGRSISPWRGLEPAAADEAVPILSHLLQSANGCPLVTDKDVSSGLQ